MQPPFRLNAHELLLGSAIRMARERQVWQHLGKELVVGASTNGLRNRRLAGT